MQEYIDVSAHIYIFSTVLEKLCSSVKYACINDASVLKEENVKEKQLVMVTFNDFN